MPTTTTDKEVEQLRKKLRKTEQERDRYRAIVSDPTAKRQRDEQVLRRRCLQVAQELQNFMRGRGHTDPNETVAAFNQRHKWKVNQLRNQLDKQGWLTPQERDTLTFRADYYSHKIGDITITLLSIGMGH